MAALQSNGQLAAPGNRQEDDRQRGRAPRSPKELSEVVEEPAKAGCVAALSVVQAGAAAVEKINGVARGAEEGAGMAVPPAVALDAVNGDDVAARFARGRVVPVLPRVAVAGGKGLEGAGSVSQARAPCVP